MCSIILKVDVSMPPKNRYICTRSVLASDMQLENYHEAEGKRVRLTEKERDRLLKLYKDKHDPRRYIGLGLMAYCGCRSQEAVDARPTDVIDSDETDRTFLRIYDGKHGSERMTPMSNDFAREIRHYTDTRRIDYRDSILSVTTRTLRRWVKRAALMRAAKEEDMRWQYVGPHDLRRTWGHLMIEGEVHPALVMEWGGWGDWETFDRHYLGKHSEEVQNRQASRVSWL